MNSQYGQIEDEMFDMMEKESGSIVKHYEEQISFLLSLNRKAMDGFNLRFYVNMIDPEYTLTSLSSDTVLHEIDDENRKTVGYLPIIRVRLEVYDHYNDETKTHKIDFQMEDCDAFIKGLQNMRNHFVESSKTYKEKLGDNVIVTED